MELFYSNPGLSHIGENIFMLLDHSSLMCCQCVCKTMRDFLQNNSEFWLKKCVQKKLPEQFYIKWKEFIQETDDEVLGYCNYLLTFIQLPK